MTDALIDEQFSNIEGNLWMGASPQYSGGAPQFTYLVNLAPWFEYPVEERQTVLTAPLLDAQTIPEPKLLYAIAEYVNRVRALGPTLVHCQAGMNRSGLITALALILAGRSAKDAIALIREKRSAMCLFNKTFEGWLLNLSPKAA